MNKKKQNLIVLALILMASARIPSSAQSVIGYENFDGVLMPALPAGWTTTLNYNIGWRTDSTNVSTGYVGASGLNNVIIRNSDSTGQYILYSPPISTIGYINISVLFASRVSNNFTSSGSSTPQFEFTVNGGANWTNIPYLENQANSTWGLVNAGTWMTLPASANNQAALQCRWKVNIVNNSQGTYRIDDAVIRGTSSTGVQENMLGNAVRVFPNPFREDFLIDAKTLVGTKSARIQVFDATGRQVLSNETNSFPFRVSMPGSAVGLYKLVITSDGEQIFSKSLVKN